MTFPEQFAHIVGRFADRLAISVRRHDGTDRFTYRRVDMMARAAAGCLSRMGLRAGDRCAIFAENDAAWCATYLGILRLGGIAVPFDTSYHAQQVAKLLGDSGAKILCTSPRFEAVAREAADAGVRVVVLSQVTAFGETSFLPIPVNPSDPAVILYTSGTTADPKGVVLTHANLVAEKEGAFQVVAVNEHDSVLGVLPLFHALAQMANLLLPLAVGAHVVFLDTLNSRELLRALDEERITIFVCVPQFFYLIHQRVTEEMGKRGFIARRVFRALLRLNGTLRHVGVNLGPLLFARVHRTLGRRMRLLITGGSKFDDGIGRHLYDLGFTILQAYGLTETSGAATITRPGEPIETVGRPFPGVEIRVFQVKPEAAPPPEGTSYDERDGEILIRGPIVMAGYWNRPDATAAVLRDGWLHTGDLGRVDPHGRLKITGRIKEMIVLSSGKNIYPEEIETHYLKSQFIKELCVLGITSASEPSAERLHAVVVPDREVMKEKKIVNTSELIRFELEGLSVSLPPHKRVLGFDISVEPLPRTTTGKLKRHEVLARWQARSMQSAPGTKVRACEEARTHEEVRADADVDVHEGVDAHVLGIIELVRNIVREGVDVRPDSNLELDLGLDSMERVELLASLEQRFGMRVPEEVAQSALLVRDLAEPFRGAMVQGDAADIAWATLLADPDPSPETRALLAPRPVAAPLLFAIATVLVRLCARPQVTGLDQIPVRGPFIISPNHQSYLDPFVLVGVLPYRVFRHLFFVGAAEYFQTPLTARLARALNIVPVDPDSNLLPAMQAGAFGLGHGKVLVLFPEGERSIDGSVKKFKKGAAILSQHLKVPIVPVAIDGVFDIWGRNRPLNWRTLLPWSGHRARIRVGEPLAAAEGETYAAQTSRVRAAVQAMWLQLNSSAGRNA